MQNVTAAPSPPPPCTVRSHITEYLPDHVISHSWSLISKIDGKASAEARIIEQFRSIPSGATRRKLVRKYLEFCWSLPYYGSAYFHSQVEQPTRSVLSVFYRPDVPVLVSINGHGVYVIDKSARVRGESSCAGGRGGRSEGNGLRRECGK